MRDYYYIMYYLYCHMAQNGLASAIERSSTFWSSDAVSELSSTFWSKSEGKEASWAAAAAESKQADDSTAVGLGDGDGDTLIS